MLDNFERPSLGVLCRLRISTARRYCERSGDDRKSHAVYPNA